MDTNESKRRKEQDSDLFDTMAIEHEARLFLPFHSCAFVFIRG
jgi:hypothetical protein